MEIYNGLWSKMKISKGCSFSGKEKRKNDHYLKYNVLPAGPEGLLNAFIVSSIPANFDIFPPCNDSSSFLSTLKS